MQYQDHPQIWLVFKEFKFSPPKNKRKRKIFLMF